MSSSTSTSAPWLHLPCQIFSFPVTRPFLAPNTTRLALPSGTYPTTHVPHPTDHETFEGGLGMMMLVRYRETPVGPYDELVFIPGEFSGPSFSSAPRERKSIRITAIYVSTQASVDAGRTNWSIPKHLALFSFTRSGSSTLVTVSLPQTPNEPFFSCLLTPVSRWLAPLPVPVRTIFSSGKGNLEGWSPLEWFVQPPLEDEEGGEAVWKRFRGKITGSARACWVGPALESGGGGGKKRLGDGRSFTEGEEAWKMGVVMDEGWLAFGVAETLRAE